MSDDVRIRPADLKDIDVIVDFNRRLARETEDRELNVNIVHNGVSGLLKSSQRGRYFVAEIAGRIVGQIMLTSEWSDWRNGEIWWIQSVYVDADFRRRGLYRRMHEHVRDLAKSKPGVVGIRLYVEEHNRTAQETYAKVGMRPEGYIVLAEIWPSADDDNAGRG